MTELDRVGKSENFNFKGVPSFLQVCEKLSQAPRKKIKCVYGDGFAKYLKQKLKCMLDHQYVM